LNQPKATPMARGQPVSPASHTRQDTEANRCLPWVSDLALVLLCPRFPHIAVTKGGSQVVSHEATALLSSAHSCAIATVGIASPQATGHHVTRVPPSSSSKAVLKPQCQASPKAKADVCYHPPPSTYQRQPPLAIL
jgi:hypothetical protein